MVTGLLFEVNLKSIMGSLAITLDKYMYYPPNMCEGNQLRGKIYPLDIVSHLLNKGLA